MNIQSLCHIVLSMLYELTFNFHSNNNVSTTIIPIIQMKEVRFLLRQILGHRVVSDKWEAEVCDDLFLCHNIKTRKKRQEGCESGEHGYLMGEHVCLLCIFLTKDKITSVV